MSHESLGSGSDGSARAGRRGLAHAGFRGGKGASGLDSGWRQEAPGRGGAGRGWVSRTLSVSAPRPACAASCPRKMVVVFHCFSLF